MAYDAWGASATRGPVDVRRWPVTRAGTRAGPATASLRILSRAGMVTSRQARRNAREPCAVVMGARPFASVLHPGGVPARAAYATRPAALPGSSPRPPRWRRVWPPVIGAAPSGTRGAPSGAEPDSPPAGLVRTPGGGDLRAYVFPPPPYSARGLCWPRARPSNRLTEHAPCRGRRPRDSTLPGSGMRDRSINPTWLAQAGYPARCVMHRLTAVSCGSGGARRGHIRRAVPVTRRSARPWAVTGRPPGFLSGQVS